MSIGQNSLLQPSGESAPAAGPLAWTRRSNSPDNFVVITADELAVGTIAKSKQELAKHYLQSGTPVDELLGPRACYIPIHSIYSISSKLHRWQVEIDYIKNSGVRGTKTFTMNEHDEMAELLLETRNRMKRGGEVSRIKGSHWQWMMKPFNLLIVLLLAAGVARLYYSSSFADMKAWRAEARREAAREQRDYPPGYQPQNYQHRPHVPFWVRRFPRAAVILIGVLAVGAVVLDTLGKYVTYTLLLGGAAACGFWLFCRLTNPPVALTVVPRD